jgi:hypothetical protein
VKVRIGISLGAAGCPATFAAAVDRLEEIGVDSLWLPEMVFGSLVDPFVGMAASWRDARDLIEQYVAAGISKFVVRPATPASADGFVEDFASELMSLQT